MALRVCMLICFIAVIVSAKLHHIITVFIIPFPKNICSVCGYSLKGLATTKYPECKKPLYR